MSTKNKQSKFKPGTWIEREMAMSRAFLHLRGFAPQLLILFLSKRHIKRTTKECTNLSDLTMTYAELENIHNRGFMGHALPKDGISRPRIIRALDELLAKGFIEIVRRGGAYKQDKSVYGLTEGWRTWRPGSVIQARVNETRVRGYVNKQQIQMSRTETLPIHAHDTVTHASQ